MIKKSGIAACFSHVLVSIISIFLLNATNGVKLQNYIDLSPGKCVAG
jgi:hypothetical protein